MRALQTREQKPTNREADFVDGEWRVIRPSQTPAHRPTETTTPTPVTGTAAIAAPRWLLMLAVLAVIALAGVAVLLICMMSEAGRAVVIAGLSGFAIGSACSAVPCLVVPKLRE